MNFLIAVIAVPAFIFLLRVCAIFYYRRHLAWEARNRHGLNYYGKTLGERRKYKEELKKRGRLLLPFLRFETSLQKRPAGIPSFEYQGVAGPPYSCSAETFKNASECRPDSRDIFVAAQMKCGTTWMQQIVFEILHRGEGDLTDSGCRHLDAVSPWIESLDGVSVQEAPLLGESKKRLLKTHLPIKLCPYSAEAKYIYVTRHPVSCFASIADYFSLMVGFLSPARQNLLDWYLSDRMYWQSWPEHVAGWWEWFQTKRNILFVHFEEMKKDLPAVICRTAEFLGERLTEEEVRKIAHKSSFEYMKQNEELFEMSPPNLFSAAGNYFKSGKLDRNKEISPESQKAILSFCREKFEGRAYPYQKFYPEIAEGLR